MPQSGKRIIGMFKFEFEKKNFFLFLFQFSPPRNILSSEIFKIGKRKKKTYFETFFVKIRYFLFQF